MTIETTEAVNAVNGGAVPPAPLASPETARNYPQIDFADLVSRIQAGDETAVESLYKIVSRGLRYLFGRQLGPQDFEDKFHETFLITIQAIQKGDLHDPQRLMGFVRTVAQRQAASHIEEQIRSRSKVADLDIGCAIVDLEQDPEREALILQKAEIVKKALAGLNPRQREILTRFYLDEQPPNQICQEMNLSVNQFRLLKSRAKAAFGQLGQKELKKRPQLVNGERASCSNEKWHHSVRIAG
ncbi:MAG: RNA polymerase sigma factor [Terriglobia bacterium]